MPYQVRTRARLSACPGPGLKRVEKDDLDVSREDIIAIVLSTDG